MKADMKQRSCNLSQTELVIWRSITSKPVRLANNMMRITATYTIKEACSCRGLRMQVSKRVRLPPSTTGCSFTWFRREERCASTIGLRQQTGGYQADLRVGAQSSFPTVRCSFPHRPLKPLPLELIEFAACCFISKFPSSPIKWDICMSRIVFDGGWNLACITSGTGLMKSTLRTYQRRVGSVL